MQQIAMYANDQYPVYYNQYANSQYYKMPDQAQQHTDMSTTNSANTASYSYLPTYSPFKYSDDSNTSSNDNSYSSYSSFDYSNWYKPYQQNSSYAQSSSPKYHNQSEISNYNSSYTQDDSLYNNSPTFTTNSYSEYKVAPSAFRPISPVDFEPRYSIPANLQTVAKEQPNIKKSARVKQLLSEGAVDIMNDWFDDHINNPYPTQEEKERMAYAGQITVKQVTAWFSNRRNRSQNTKPKRMRRVLEKEISTIFSHIVDNTPGTFSMIERLKSTISSNI